MEVYLQQLPQQLINGLTLGGVYALIAIGYSMVYGILGMLNFAHGEVYMIGGFAGWWVLHLLTRNNEVLFSAVLVIALMLIMAMAISALIGVIAERFAYRPLRNAPRINMLLSALGCVIADPPAPGQQQGPLPRHRSRQFRSRSREGAVVRC